MNTSTAQQAGKATKSAKKGAEQTGEKAGRAGAKVGEQVTALPGRVAKLTRLMTLRRFLKAAPVVAVAVVVGRLVTRKR